MCVFVCVCIKCACTCLCGCVCERVRVRMYVGVKRYERDVSTTCLPKKENCRNCMVEEISPIRFKCNEYVSERRTGGMKPDKI